MSPKYSPWRILLLIVAFVTGFLAFRPIWDIDVFWHIAAGNWILDKAAFPDSDIFTFVTPAPTWHTFQWLYEVTVAGLDRIGGLILVRAFHALVTASAFTLFVRFSLRFFLNAGRESVRARAVGLAAVAFSILLILYSDRVRARPHVFNLLFWPILLDLLLVCRLRTRVQKVAAVGVVFLWANIHAGGAFIFLAAALALPVASTATAILRRRFLKTAQKKAAPLSVSSPEANGSRAESPAPATGRWSCVFESPGHAWAVWGAFLAVCLLSPNWALGVIQAHLMYGQTGGYIQEWSPFWSYFTNGTHLVHAVCAVAPILGAGAAVGLVAGRGPRVLEVVLLSLGLAFLPYQSARFVYFEAFVFVLAAPVLVGGLLERFGNRRFLRPAGAMLILTLVAFSLHFHTLAQYRSLRTYWTSMATDLDERRFPVELVKPLESIQQSLGRGDPPFVFCLPSWGGYLLYRLYPGVRVIADGRGNIPTVLREKMEFLYRYRNQHEHGPMVERIYNESGANVVAMPILAFPRTYRPANWAPVYAGRKGELWVRTGR